jgi:hypothetical protein
MTVENVLDAYHKAGIDISVVSNAAHYMRGKAEKDELAAIQRWNDYAGTPAPIVHKLRDEIAAIGNDPEFRRRRLIETSLDPVFDTPEEFAAFLKQDRANAERVMRESGLQSSHTHAGCAPSPRSSRGE